MNEFFSLEETVRAARRMEAYSRERGVSLEKRKVTIWIGGQPCSFYSDDSDEYLSALEQRANAAMRQTARFSGSSAYANAVLSVLSLTDTLFRTEQKMKEIISEKEGNEPKAHTPRKAIVKGKEEENGQVSVWDLLDEAQQ